MRQRSFRWVTPGAIVGVLLWLMASYGFATYLSKVAVGAVYDAFAGAIVLVGWLWLTNVALLFGAERTPRSTASRSSPRASPSRTRSTGRNEAVRPTVSGGAAPAGVHPY